MEIEVSVLSSGSSGNSIYINDGKNSFLIDAGLSGKKLINRLKKIDVTPQDLDGILITHEHKDHTKGVGILSRRLDIPIYANEETWAVCESELGKLKDENMQSFTGNFSFGNFDIKPIAISHDARAPVSYVVYRENKKMVFATDMGYINEELMKELKNIDLLLLESNHDIDMLMSGSYPRFLKRRIRGEKGHLSNDAAAQILPELINGKCPQVLLGHLSEENNNPKVAYLTVENMLKAKGLEVDKDLKLDLTYQHKPTRIYKIK
ncbi:MAG: MBL fold metallo-hydrolase [Halanaerobiales bacterium]|nr:MBL fold metallo-hydrolase [Halanaerobiales bacterium]